MVLPAGRSHAGLSLVGWCRLPGKALLPAGHGLQAEGQLSSEGAGGGPLSHPFGPALHSCCLICLRVSFPIGSELGGKEGFYWLSPSQIPTSLSKITVLFVKR